MANTSDVAAAAAVPSSADIERAAEFAREPFLLDGEGPEALAPGTARRRALDAALSELDAGAEHPSIEWRRDFSLLLGLVRFLAEEPPKLRDGAELNPHQGDALSGTLAELMAQQQIVADGELRNGGSAAVEEDGDGAAAPDGGAPEAEAVPSLEGEDELEDEDEELAPDEEPQDWEEGPAEEDEETIEEAPEDPGAARRFWFEHATGAGKTVAAVGFIEATRTGGVLILTHRRNLVEQFIDGRELYVGVMGNERLDVFPPWEMSFEKMPDNIQAAVTKRGITYPVAQDNAMETWKAYGNRFWPAEYLIDKEGKIVYTHFGEGDYDVTENRIRDLLGIADRAEAGPEDEVPSSKGQTRETYLGTTRAANESKDGTLPLHRWALSGAWTRESQATASLPTSSRSSARRFIGQISAAATGGPYTMTSQNAPTRRARRRFQQIL